MMNHDYQKIPLQRLVNVESSIQSERIVQESIITLHSIGGDGSFFEAQQRCMRNSLTFQYS